MSDYDIFISYRTSHREWVETLARNLKAQHYKVFLDAWELIPGQDFTQKIYQALQQAKKAILVATPDAIESGWVQQEHTHMLNRQINDKEFILVPVVLGEFPDFPFLKTVQAVDFKDSSEAQYRSAFHRLLCGLEKKPPGDHQSFSGQLSLPGATREEAIDPQINGIPFSQQILDSFVNRVPILLLGQADASGHLLASALKAGAEQLYGAENCYHLYPPTSTRADSKAYFGRLAKQFGIHHPVEECWEWADEVADRLAAGNELFLLITGVENGPEECRGELAGELRQLHERFSATFHLVLMGGERLAAQKFALGAHSLLNLADPQLIPETEAQRLSSVGTSQAIDPSALQTILHFTGGQPRLVQYCLQKRATSAQACEEALRSSPLPSQLFSRFQDPAQRGLLCERLGQDDLGLFDLWPLDEITRRLFWNNLLKQQHGRLVWRGDFIRRIGREMLGCE